MSTQMVPISESSRRVLQDLAEKTGQSQMNILDKALDAYRRKLFLENLNERYAELRADPAAWAEVEAERRLMDGCLMDGLDPAECWEWPSLAAAGEEG